MSDNKELTKEETEEVLAFRKKTFEESAATMGSDKPACEEVFRYFYDYLKLPTPQIIWYPSFPSAIIGQLMMLKIHETNKKDMKKFIKTGLMVEPKEQKTYGGLLAGVWAITESVLVPFYAETYGETKSFGDFKQALNNTFVDKDVRGLLNNQRTEMYYGNSEVFWAYFKYAKDKQKCDFTQDEENMIEAWFTLSKESGWWWPYEKYLFVSEKGQFLNPPDINTTTRLHSASSPVITFKDGYEGYCYNGVGVPKEWITSPDTVDPTVCLTHENMELRLLAREILGWPRVMKALKPTTIDVDDDPIIGKLIEADLPESGKNRFHVAMCGTGREVVQRVPPTVTTALEASAWLNQIDIKEVRNYEFRT